MYITTDQIYDDPKLIELVKLFPFPDDNHDFYFDKKNIDAYKVAIIDWNEQHYQSILADLKEEWNTLIRIIIVLIGLPILLINYFDYLIVISFLLVTGLTFTSCFDFIYEKKAKQIYNNIIKQRLQNITNVTINATIFPYKNYDFYQCNQQLSNYLKKNYQPENYLNEDQENLSDKENCPDKDNSPSKDNYFEIFMKDIPIITDTAIMSNYIELKSLIKQFQNLNANSLIEKDVKDLISIFQLNFENIHVRNEVVNITNNYIVLFKQKLLKLKNNDDYYLSELAKLKILNKMIEEEINYNNLKI